MAERRMFARTIISSDAFLDMPLTTQALYFHLAMNADDDGFVNNPRKIQRMVGASDDELKLLIAKNFIIPFSTGIIAIRHWKMHNYIQKDRYKPTLCTEEQELLSLDGNGVYALKALELSQNSACIQNVSKMDTECIQTVSKLYPDCIQNVSKMDTQVSIGKSKVSLEKSVHAHGAYQNVKLTDDEVEKLTNEYGKELTADAIAFLDEYIAEKGYKSKSHYLAIRRWVIGAVQERQNKKRSSVNDDLMQIARKAYDFGNDGSTGN